MHKNCYLCYLKPEKPYRTRVLAGSSSQKFCYLTATHCYPGGS